MSLEERIVNELKAERGAVPLAAPGPIPTVESRWPRHLSVAAALVVLVAGGIWGIGRWAGGGDIVAAALEAGELVIDGGVVVPIDADLGTIDDRGTSLRVFRGAQAPAPTIDLDLEGVEQPLTFGQPNWDETSWAGDVPLVYVGDRSGRSVFLHTNGTIGFIDRLLNPDLGDHICMSMGDSSSPKGGSGFCSGAGGSVGGRFHDNEAGAPVDAWWVTWVDVPAGTSVVTLTVAGEAFAWQRPVAETALFDLLQRPDGLVTLTALGSDGSELASETLPADTFFE